MKKSIKAFVALIMMCVMPFAVNAQNADLDPENTIYLDLEYGRVVIKMYPEVAPNHVARIKELTREGFYDGLVFHRVIDGFMAQTGDPDGLDPDLSGRGGSGQNIDAEFSDLSHYKGMVSMARGNDENSADSQFFIVRGFSPHLDGQYTVWGEVVQGMRYVDKIKIGVVAQGLADPDKIIKMQVAADVNE
ncbi:peptidylprolyl isomerase [Pseudemcibacter aquimaris]|uniref:peptidylprolyl isomerase n=1 Tax=Pseudemcibacter aquimaris TaxID=2857064 RepID=UPI002010D3B3|nr:peptidylprolyl isomerase [Pseudemcibacter aquimaris]MCC3860108.1 peptidylprolyl isomerase [Pseudemcibacter aquimaris]WDU57437.1 peptidylprolyl isomerase [Pseudemcibacter aquimaris]